MASASGSSRLCPPNHSAATILDLFRLTDCRKINESTRPLTGAGKRSKLHESSFPGKCVGGGHAGDGHRSGAVGDQDFLRHLNKQELASGDKVVCVKRRPTKDPFRGGGSLLFNRPATSFALVRFARCKRAINSNIP